MNRNQQNQDGRQPRAYSVSPPRTAKAGDNQSQRIDFLKQNTSASASARQTSSAAPADSRTANMSKRITNVFNSGSAADKAEADDDKVIRLSGAPNVKSPDKKNMPVMEQKGKNLDQFIVDNPPIKDHGAVLVTDQVFIGDAATSCDASFIRQNKISHIVNTNSATLLNIYDINNINNPEVKQKLTETGQMGSNLVGSISYFKMNWDEHKITGLTNMKFLTEVYRFMQEAVLNFNSCLIVSQRNKCCTVVIAIVYLMMKYKWSVIRSLEYLNGRKSDIEITKLITKQLQQVEQTIQSEISQKGRNSSTEVSMRNNWEIDENIGLDLNEENLLQHQIQRFGSLQQVIIAQKEEERQYGAVQSPGQTFALMRKQSSMGKNKSIDKDFSSSKFVMVEEEASMINQYLNSLKLEKAQPAKKPVQPADGPAKTMKELIDETIRDNARRKELLKKLLDWNELDIVINPKVIERKQVKQFNKVLFPKKKPQPNKKYLTKPQNEVNEKLSVVNEHTYEESDINSNNKNKEKHAIRKQISNAKGNQLKLPIVKGQNLDEGGSDSNMSSQRYKPFISTGSNQSSEERPVGAALNKNRREIMKKSTRSSANEGMNSGESQVSESKGQKSYKKKIEKVMKIINISKFWKQLPAESQKRQSSQTLMVNNLAMNSESKKSDRSHDHKSQSFRNIDPNLPKKGALVDQIKNRSESFNMNHQVTPFKKNNLDESTEKNLKKINNNLTINSNSSLSQNRDSSMENEGSSVNSLQNNQIGIKNYKGSLKSAEKLQKKLTTTESQATGQTAATKGLVSNANSNAGNKYNESSIGSGLIQRKQETFKTSQQQTFTKQDTSQLSGSKLSKQDVNQRAAKESNNEMNFKLKIQTTIINEEEDEQNVRKSVQRANSSSELYKNHNAKQVIQANSSQSITGKLSDEISDSRTLHSAHSAERAKKKAGIIKPQGRTKATVVPDRMIGSQKQSSGESSILNSNENEQIKNRNNQFIQDQKNKQKDNKQLMPKSQQIKNEQSKVSKAQQQTDNQLHQSRKQPASGQGLQQPERTSSTQEANSPLKPRVQHEALESQGKQRSERRAGNMSPTNVIANEAAKKEQLGLLSQKQVQMLRAKHFAPDSSASNTDTPVQKQQPQSNQTTPAQAKSKQKQQAAPQNPNVKKGGNTPKPAEPQQQKSQQKATAEALDMKNASSDQKQINTTSKKERPQGVIPPKKPVIELNDTALNDFTADNLGANAPKKVLPQLKIASSQRAIKQDPKLIIEQQKQINIQAKNQQVVEKQGKYLSIKPNQVNYVPNSNNTSGVTQPSNTQSAKEYQSAQSANAAQRAGQHRKHRSVSGFQRTHSSSDHGSAFNEFDEPSMARTIRKEPGQKKMSMLPEINSASNLHIQSGDIQKRAVSNRAESSQQNALGQSNGFKQAQKQTQSVSQMARKQQQQIKQLNQELKIQKEATSARANINFTNQAAYRQQDPYNSGVEGQDLKIHLLGGRQSNISLGKNDLGSSQRSSGRKLPPQQQAADSEIGLQAEKAQQQILKQRQLQQAGLEEKNRQLLLQAKQQEAMKAKLSTIQPPSSGLDQAQQQKQQSDQLTADQIKAREIAIQQQRQRQRQQLLLQQQMEQKQKARTEKNSPREEPLTNDVERQQELIRRRQEQQAAIRRQQERQAELKRQQEKQAELKRQQEQEAEERKKQAKQKRKQEESDEEQNAQDYMALALAKIQAKMDSNQERRKQEAIENAKKAPVKQGPKKYTPGEVAAHKTLQDCWIILGKGVYDVSKFIMQHPGGSMTLLELAGTGKDALAEFNAAGHSKGARVSVKKYLIGELA